MTRLAPLASMVAALALLLPLCLGTAGCVSASIDVSRTTQTSGRFESKATTWLIFWWEVPGNAMDIARDNAADARLRNVQVTEAYETPHFGWFDWIYQFLGVRWATVRGTWGFDGNE